MPITLRSTRELSLDQPHVHSLAMTPPEQRINAYTDEKHVPKTP